jgi:iron complex transport system substrate-binding protein
VLVALMAGCGRESVSSAPSTKVPQDFPVTLQTAAGSTTLSKAPTRVVSLSPTATEMLFAIHAGKQVVAVDDQSNYPAQVPRTKLSGFQPNVEAIANYKPDLVVYDGTAKTLAPALRALKIPVVAEPAAKTLDDTYSQIAQLGIATGHDADGTRLISQMRHEITGVVANAPKLKRPATYYHELDSTYFSVTSKTFIGQAYKLLGLSNIADAADKAGTGYPQLSSEYIVRSSPDMIFLADTKCCKQSEQTVSRRPGWSSISAIKNHDVVALDDDIASRWGPRVVDFLRTVAAAIRDAKSPTQ